jgi:hypothetical protein
LTRFQFSPVVADGCHIMPMPTGTVRVPFQSSPLVTDRCQETSRAAWLPIAGFNPHSSSPTGATLPCPSVNRRYAVSILTRRQRRVPRSLDRWRARRTPCFNLHPSATTGATWVRLHSVRGLRDVSILARRHRRVPRNGNTRVRGILPVSILTRRERRAPPTGAHWLIEGVAVSIPTRRHRRVPCPPASATRSVSSSFNPRPSSPTGATVLTKIRIYP